MGLAVAGLAAACGADPALRPVGVSGYGSDAEKPATSGSASTSAHPSWAPYASASSWPRANGRRFTSLGHYFGRFDAEIRVRPSAERTYASGSPTARYAIGDAVIEQLYARTAEGTPGPVLAMEKGESGWRYLELDASGNVLRADAALAPCAGCHAHAAPQDALFGVPESGR
jgi:hypothetical protein